MGPYKGDLVSLSVTWLSIWKYWCTSRIWGCLKSTHWWFFKPCCIYLARCFDLCVMPPRLLYLEKKSDIW